MRGGCPALLLPPDVQERGFDGRETEIRVLEVDLWFVGWFFLLC